MLLMTRLSHSVLAFYHIVILWLFVRFYKIFINKNNNLFILVKFVKDQRVQYIYKNNNLFILVRFFIYQRVQYIYKNKTFFDKKTLRHIVYKNTNRKMLYEKIDIFYIYNIPLKNYNNIVKFCIYYNIYFIIGKFIIDFLCIGGFAFGLAFICHIITEFFFF
jgi:hypothetical protein